MPVFLNIDLPMTSVDSGVETGNDSNDSYANFDSQPTAQEVSPVKIPINSLCPVQQSQNNSVMNKTSSTDQPNGSVDIKDHEDCENLQFRLPLQRASTTLEVDPPAGLSFHNLQPLRLGHDGPFAYEVRGLKSCQQDSSRKWRNQLMTRRNQRMKYWESYIQVKRPLDQRKLRQAASTNNVDQVVNLLDAGVDPNSTDEQRRSPLHLAACRGYYDVVRHLLERGADPNRRDSLGNTPLHLAACTNNIGVVTLLLKAGTDVSSSDHYGRSPLQLAQSKLKLLQRGAASTEDSNVVKTEVRQVIEMMLAYLHKRGQEIEAELLGAFSSRLTLSNTRAEVEQGVSDLLASLASLSIEKSVSDETNPNK